MPENNSNQGLISTILQKDVTEAIFKNLTGFLACGALLKLASTFSTMGNWLSGLMLLFTCVSLFALSIGYGVNHILVPIDSATGGMLKNLKQLNSVDQTNWMRLWRALRTILFSCKGLTYIGVGFIYVGLSFQIVGMTAAPGKTDSIYAEHVTHLTTTPHAHQPTEINSK